EAVYTREATTVVWLQNGAHRVAWFAFARILFVLAVAYAAAILRPLPVSLSVNITFALFLAVLVVLLERRLWNTSVTRILGALSGGAIGLLLARTIAEVTCFCGLMVSGVPIPA